jgi:oligopeptide/dipeptide ABC transporter ATP-binding protein
MSAPVIRLENVTREFEVKRKKIKAVDGVSFDANRGEVLCLVGESGCGKTTTGLMMSGLLKPTGGKIFYQGQDIATLKGNDMRKYRLAVQMVHQDPYASLNPVHTVYEALAFPLRRHKITNNERETRDLARELLRQVDLTPPDDLLDKFPHQLSGGQRQRVSIARALTVHPSFIVADEAVSMVDVSIRISLLNTLLHLKDEMGLAVLFITHDLALAKYFAWEGRVGVMYLGRMVEISPARDLIEHPQHPYTKVLLSAIPEADPDVTRKKERIPLRSMDVPSLMRLPTGCTFHPRCPFYLGDICRDVVPPLLAYPDGTAAACHAVAQEREGRAVAVIPGPGDQGEHTRSPQQPA